jgi:hypothetical protein
MFTLYSVRINQNRFQYGIYSTFGAGFGRLVSTSVFEMMVVSFVALPLSALFTWGISALIYSSVNVAVVWSLDAFVKVLIMNLAVVAAGVVIPMKIVSTKTPMSLIRAEDNSNLVSSPRSTRFMRGDKFLKVYELLGMWRFRKYYLKLLASAVIFSAIFICGAYVADMNQKASELPIEQFSISTKKPRGTISNDEGLLSRHMQDADYFFDTIGAYEGVNSVEYTDEIFAANIGRKGYIEPAYSYGVMGIAMPGWAFGTAFGVIAGDVLPDFAVSALSVALFGMFIAIIVPPAMKNRVIAALLLVSFALSTAANKLPVFAGISQGIKTIILTVVISLAAAIVRPIPMDSDCE